MKNIILIILGLGLSLSLYSKNIDENDESIHKIKQHSINNSDSVKYHFGNYITLLAGNRGYSIWKMTNHFFVNKKNLEIFNVIIITGNIFKFKEIIFNVFYYPELDKYMITGIIVDNKIIDKDTISYEKLNNYVIKQRFKETKKIHDKNEK